MALKNTWSTGETFTASDQNDIANEILGINKSGTYSSLPAAGHPGRLYVCTDIDLVLQDNGTSWDRVHIGSEGGTPTAPPTSGWSTSLGGSSTVAADKDGRLFTVPSVAGVNWRLEYRTLSPTSNYTFTAYLESALYAAADGYATIILRNSSSGSFIVFGHQAYSSGFFLTSVKYSSTTVGIAVYASQAVTMLPEGLPKWLRIRDNGTNRFFEYSYNGLDWQLHYSVGRTDYITPDQIGWGVHCSGGQTNYARLRSFSVV